MEEKNILLNLHISLVHCDPRFLELLSQAIAREKFAMQRICQPSALSWPFNDQQTQSRIYPGKENKTWKNDRIRTYFEEGQEAVEENLAKLTKNEENLEENAKMENSTEIGHIKPNDEETAKKKAKFVRMMTHLEGGRERTRQVLSKSKYAAYVRMLRRIGQQQSKPLNYRDMRIARRFMLDPARQNRLLDRNSGKPFLGYEDMFDCIHRGYLQPKFGGLRAVHAELKRNYANITMQCVNVYLSACGYEMKARGD